MNDEGESRVALIEKKLEQLYFGGPASAATSLEDQMPMMRSILVSENPDEFLEALERFVDDKTQEIETVCGENYEDFVASVTNLLRVRQEIVSLMARINELNDDIQKSGQRLTDKKKTLLDARKVGANIDDAAVEMRRCLNVLDLAAKVDDLFKQGKYFMALRRLQDLEWVHLPSIAQYPFASLMREAIPAVRQSIRDAVTRDFKAWMYEARQASRPVGQVALDAMDLRIRKWAQKRKRLPAYNEAQVNGPLELGYNERSEFDPLDNDIVHVSFKNLFWCIHIYDALDAHDEIVQIYDQDRNAQAELLLSERENLPYSLELLSDLVEDITGFLVIESNVLRTTHGFRSEKAVDALWDSLCAGAVKIVDKGLEKTEDPTIYLGTKLKVLSFVQTLKSAGYSVDPLNNLLQTLFDNYSHALQRKYSGDFAQIVADDDHQPMIVNDPDEFSKVVSVSWLPSRGDWAPQSLAKGNFPIALPFSQTYPLCCIDIRSFTEQYYQFSEGFAVHHRDIDDVLRQALDDLLTTHVAKNIEKRASTLSNLPQLAQIFVNILFFQTACHALESLLVSLRAYQRGGVVHLDSSTAFRHTLYITQERIVEMLANKIDAFFDEADYDWLTLTPPSSREPSFFLVELTDFLSTVMGSILAPLPAFSKDQVSQGAYAHLVNVFLRYLVSPEPRRVSDAALMHFSRDISYLIDQSSRSSNQLLADVFLPLSQLLALVSPVPSNGPRMLDYLNSSVRVVSFARVDPLQLKALLTKIHAHHQGLSSAMLNPTRKSEVDELLKALDGS